MRFKCSDRRGMNNGDFIITWGTIHYAIVTINRGKTLLK